MRDRDLVLDGMGKALRVRRAAGHEHVKPICVYDLADSLGIEVRFDPFPSLEGMYRKSPSPLIVLSSLRPRGRQAFTCAHELGHHVYGHGTRVDDLIGEDRRKALADPTEFLADCFAAGLLMPKVAVEHSFAIRGWDVRRCTAEQIYTIAGLFGVGYTTLIGHVSRTLGLLHSSEADKLRSLSPKSIRSSLLGRESSGNVLVVDEHWPATAIDIGVGDTILFPLGTLLEGNCAQAHSGSLGMTAIEGVMPGIGRVSQPDAGWASFVRVSRAGYAGRSIFRHLEDPDYEADTALR